MFALLIRPWQATVSAGRAARARLPAQVVPYQTITRSDTSPAAPRRGCRLSRPPSAAELIVLVRDQGPGRPETRARLMSGLAVQPRRRPSRPQDRLLLLVARVMVDTRAAGPHDNRPSLPVRAA